MIHYITPTGIASAWVANEIGVVTRHGVPVTLHSLHASKQKFFSSPWAKRLDAETRVIYPVPKAAGAISVLLAPLLFGTRFFSALGNAIFGERENVRNRLVAFLHLLVACHWARGLRKSPPAHIHSQWIHSGGTVGMYGAWLLGVPFSFTGHAADLYRERCALRDKVRRASFIVCISEFHRRFFLEEGARPQQLQVVYCGIDLSHFVPRRPRRERGEPVVVVSSGRLVEKKGFVQLVEACGILRDEGVRFRCVIGGDGPQEGLLRAKVAELGLQDHVSLTGQALTQEALPDFMHAGHIYALPCVWAKDGDVDGLPQMLMEAMACGLPAVSTRLVGIPDLITDGETGLLVESGNVRELAAALRRLIEDAALADRLAAGGERAVRERFEINAALQPLIRRFGAVLDARSGPAEARPSAAAALHGDAA